MFKTLKTFTACAALVAAGALHSAAAIAQTPAYYFVSVCAVPNMIDCPWGPNPFWFGPYTSQAQCDAAQAQWQGGYFGTYPRVLSTCYIP